jgi:hypothetical protein
MEAIALLVSLLEMSNRESADATQMSFKIGERREHLTFAAKLEIGVRSQELGARRKEEEGRSQNKCFYKDEMLPERMPAIQI